MYTDAEKLSFLKLYKENLCNISRSVRDFNKLTKEKDDPKLVRDTVRRWRLDDEKFNSDMEEAELEVIEDAEQTLKGCAIVDKNITAIIFLLKNKHPEYAEKLNLKANVNVQRAKSERIERITNAIEKFITRRETLNSPKTE